MEIYEKAQEYLSETIAFRRDLHTHPELSAQISRTADKVTEKLKEWKIPYTILPGNGIIAAIKGCKKGRTVALRADMDALPIQEISDKPYRSVNSGIAHLCGHDCHTASLVTAARILNEKKETLKGEVRLIFQAAEEDDGCDARMMIRGGAMDHVDAIFGVHMYSDIDVGQISVDEGQRMAASFSVDIEITGKGSHGGSPQLGIDAVVCASAIVMNLQTIVSREISPFASAAITVGKFNAGASSFAVSEKAELGLTVKYYDPEMTGLLKESITRIVENTAAAYRAVCRITIKNFFNPVINDPELSKIAEKSAQKILSGKEIRKYPPWCATEDFSEYLTKAPGVFAFIGIRSGTDFCLPPHNPGFDVDENALAVASALYAQFAVDFLSI